MDLSLFLSFPFSSFLFMFCLICIYVNFLVFFLSLFNDSKSEFVIYKLKEMGRVTENDILQICKQFDSLEHSNYDKITLVDLMEGNR